MKRLFFITVFLVFCLSFTAYGQLKFSESKNVNSLQLVNESKDYSAGNMTKIVSLQVDINDAKKNSMRKKFSSFDFLQIDDLTTIVNEAEPITYVKSSAIELEKNARVTGIRLISGDYVEIQENINLAPCRKPVTWMKDAKNNLELEKDPVIYSTDAF